MQGKWAHPMANGINTQVVSHRTAHPGLRCRYLTQTDLDVLKRCPCLGDQKLSGGWRNRSASLGLKTETSVRFKRILNAKANCHPLYAAVSSFSVLLLHGRNGEHSLLE